MVSKFALLSNLLLASAVPAVPSYRDHLSRYDENRQSQLIEYAESPAGIVLDTEFSNTWAGAAWFKPKGTFDYVTGTFTVPTPSGADGSASIWVGIDGASCPSIFQAGINVGIKDGEPEYDAWYEWYPQPAIHIPPSKITIKAGDSITLTVASTSTTSGTVMIENHTTKQYFHTDHTSLDPLCEMNAEWIVENYRLGIFLVPFVNIGSVTFTNAFACDHQVHCYTPHGATLLTIIQWDIIRTSVSADEHIPSLTINYI